MVGAIGSTSVGDVVMSEGDFSVDGDCRLDTVALAGNALRPLKTPAVSFDLACSPGACVIGIPPVTFRLFVESVARGASRSIPPKSPSSGPDCLGIIVEFVLDADEFLWPFDDEAMVLEAGPSSPSSGPRRDLTLDGVRSSSRMAGFERAPEDDKEGPAPTCMSTPDRR